MSFDPQYGPTVGLDGAAVRRTREAKGLTQLYVAEVVGVTVDTVSRWENNRTSAVKRENAEALAGALEVELGQILRGPEQAPEGGGAPSPTGRRSARLLRKAVAAAALTIAAAIGLFFLFRSPATSVEAVRQLPAYLRPGGAAPVLIKIRLLSGGARRVILRERLPPGWKLERSILAPDAGPGADGLVRWIVPIKGPETLIGYLVRAPADAPVGSTYRFSGEVVVPGRRGEGDPIEGDVRTDLEWVHWADQNGDFHLSDAELLDALERLEAVKTLNPDATDLRPLWGAGEYSWDEVAQSFRPTPR